VAQQLPLLPQELIDAVSRLTGGNELLSAIMHLNFSESPEAQDLAKRIQELIATWKTFPSRCS
jgi:hypothetical protein